MTLKVILKWMVLLTVGLITTQASADQTLILKTQKEKQSYAMGVELYRNWKQQGVDFDLDLVIRGMKDVQLGNRLLLTEGDLKTSLKVLGVELLREKAAGRVIAGQENKKKGEVFLAENKAKPGVVTLPSGLQYKILKAGEGRKPTEADTVECRYRLTHIDGTGIENNGEEVGVFKVSEVISGWREALKLMSVGSTWLLFIPPQLAYGQRGKGHIGSYETLIYEIELVNVK